MCIQYEMWSFCVPCKHITNDIIVPDGCQYVHWLCARNVPFHLFDGDGPSPRRKAKNQLSSEGPLECVGRCEVRISGSYYLKYRTCELPSLTLRSRKTIQPILNAMSANRNSSVYSLSFWRVWGGLIVPSCGAGDVGHRRMGNGASPSRK